MPKTHSLKGPLESKELSGNEADLAKVLREARGKRVAFVSGYFNILHPGHLRLLRFARECADYLVVGVFPNETLRQEAILSEELRLENIIETRWVNHAFILRTSPVEFIRHLKPQFVIKGSEFQNQANPEQEVLEEYGGKILFNSGDVSFSSIDLHFREIRELKFSTIDKDKAFLERHRIEPIHLSRVVEDIQNLKVLVLGDVIVDEYIDCEPLGMSQEDPTIVVSPILRERFMGGAGIVAAHAAGLGAQATLLSVTGSDELDAVVLEKLGEYKVSPIVLQDESRPTTLKQRFRAAGKTLLRVSHLRQHDISEELQQKLLESLDEHLEGTHLVMFSDFNYGCLPQKLVDEVVRRCQRRGVPMVADSQSSSQVGDISRFKGMKLISPTEREARLAIQDHRSGMVMMANRLREKADCENVFVTLGSEGLFIHTNGENKEDFLTDRIPAMNFAPKDISGAGDSLFVTAGLSLVAGGNIWESAFLGSLAASCQVSRKGNIPLTQQELQWEIWN